MLDTTLNTVAQLISREYESDMEFLTLTISHSDVQRALAESGKGITDHMMGLLMRRLDAHFTEYERNELICRHFEQVVLEEKRFKKIPVRVSTIEDILEKIERGETSANDPEIVKALRDLLPQ